MPLGLGHEHRQRPLQLVELVVNSTLMARPSRGIGWMVRPALWRLERNCTGAAGCPGGPAPNMPESAPHAPCAVPAARNPAASPSEPPAGYSSPQRLSPWLALAPTGSAQALRAKPARLPVRPMLATPFNTGPSAKMRTPCRFGPPERMPPGGRPSRPALGCQSLRQPPKPSTA